MRLLELRSNIDFCGHKAIMKTTVDLDRIVCVKDNCGIVDIEANGGSYNAPPFTYEEILTLWQEKNESRFEALKEHFLNMKKK